LSFLVYQNEVLFQKGKHAVTGTGRPLLINDVPLGGKFCSGTTAALSGFTFTTRSPIRSHVASDKRSDGAGRGPTREQVRGGQVA
jgi:hypothetical protein